MHGLSPVKRGRRQIYARPGEKKLLVLHPKPMIDVLGRESRTRKNPKHRAKRPR